MKNIHIATASIALMVCKSANAINAKYKQQLQRSGCTQVSEEQGFDIHKTKAEDVKLVLYRTSKLTQKWQLAKPLIQGNGSQKQPLGQW